MVLRHYYHLLIILFSLSINCNGFASKEELELTDSPSISSSTVSEGEQRKRTKKRESPIPLSAHSNKKYSPPESPNQRKISDYFSKASSSANLLPFSAMDVDAADYVASTPKTSISDIDSGTVSESAIVLQDEQLFDETLSQFSSDTGEEISQSNSEIPAVSLDLDSLPFHVSHPKTYSLLRVNSARINSVNYNLEVWQHHENFREIGPNFLKTELAINEDINFEEEENDKNPSWLRIHREQITEKKGHYIIVQLLKKDQSLKALNLVESLISENTRRAHSFGLQAALIIFPYTQNEAMIYGLGKWNMLLNPACIVPQWGLRMLSSTDMCNPDNIKGISADYHRTANPSSRYESKNKGTRIESFGIEVGSEELESMRAQPSSLYKTSHILTGQDYLKFTISPRNPRAESVDQSLQSLEKIAKHFFERSTLKSFHIHERVQEYIDEEVREPVILKALNDKLLELIKSPNNKFEIFIHKSLWLEHKTKYISFGEKGNRSLFKVIGEGKLNSLSQTIEIWCGRSDGPKDLVITQFLFSNPIEYNKKFYRFKKGLWYEVAVSRFESIKRIMRQNKLPQQNLQLPDYSFQDTERSDQTALTPGVDYKEANYNTRAAKIVGTNGEWEAVLLDRLNISLGKRGDIDKFEFADLLLRHQDNFYIVHIKRDGSNALSHHREQVERSADFIATELIKNNEQDLILKGVINGLYQTFSLPTKKIKNQGKRLTKGNHFQSLLKGKQSLLDSAVSDENNLSIFKKEVSQLNIVFAKENEGAFAIALDALYDCVVRGISTEKVITEAAEFFESVKQAVEAQKFLFRDGVLRREQLEKIRIVLAVIDDRNIERHLDLIEKTKKKLIEANKNKKGEEDREIKALEEELQKLLDAMKNIDSNKRNKNPLFKNQDLWGLDRTRTTVQKYGLGFNVVIINEDDDKNDGMSWDAFGSIIKREEQEISDSMMIDYQKSIFRLSEEIRAPLSLITKPCQEISQHMQSIEESSHVLDFNTVQMLKYVDSNGQNYTFSTCPTIGDGDCFFHAAFTEEGDGPQIVRERAARMRGALCNALQEGQYIDDIRHLVYEHYIDLLANNLNHSDVPQTIKDIIIEKDEYAATYSGMQKFGLLTETTPNPEDRYSVHIIKCLISHDHIKDYIERLRTVGGEETYIPFRPNIICPAHILATLGGKQINIFTFDSQSKELKFIKTAGTDGPVVNVLHTGNHFVRLNFII